MKGLEVDDECKQYIHHNQCVILTYVPSINLIAHRTIWFSWIHILFINTTIKNIYE